MKHINGDLSLAARLGQAIRCIKVPDISFWTEFASPPDHYFTIPQVGRIYYLHAHIVAEPDFLGPYTRGVLVAEKLPNGNLVRIQNPQITFMGHLLGEPFFSYDCFMIISRP